MAGCDAVTSAPHPADMSVEDQHGSCEPCSQKGKTRNCLCGICVRISSVMVRTWQLDKGALISRDQFGAEGLTCGCLRAPLQRLDTIHQEASMSYIQSRLV